MKKWTIPLLAIFIALGSCTLEKHQKSLLVDAFKPRIFGITVSDMDRSMEWYTTHLGFVKDTISHFESSGISVGMMHLGDFYIELVTFEGSISKSELNLPKEYSNLHGYFKMGFQSQDIDALYQKMIANQVDIVAKLNDLPAIENYDWPKKYFLIQDPDGNYIQFFSQTQETQMDTRLHPFLIAVSTPNIEASIKWFNDHMHTQTIGEKVGNPGNERILLEKDGFILELGQFEDDRSFGNLTTPEDVWRSKVHGINKLSFLVNDINLIHSAMQQANVQIDFELTETNAMTGDRYFMIQDDFDCSIQFFEIDQ